MVVKEAVSTVVTGGAMLMIELVEAMVSYAKNSMVMTTEAVDGRYIFKENGFNDGSGRSEMGLDERRG